ncbi:MAG: VOC family protein [Myxococcales bacterium]|nr:VOC family protein [Myxococcales bacterium]
MAGLLHAAIRVMDMDKSVDFYVNKLGWELARIKKLEKAKATLAYVRPRGTAFELELVENWGRTEPYLIGDGFAHVALEVEDLPKTFEALKAKGVPFRKEPFALEGEGPPRIAFITDPDGYSIELIQADFSAEG